MIRNNQRNGVRIIPYNTRLGTIDLKIPKLREGIYFPNFLEPRRMLEKALLMLFTKHINGVNTRMVYELVQALGMEGIDKSIISQISQELDEHVNNLQTFN